MIKKKTFEELKFYIQEFQNKCININSIFKWLQKGDVLKKLNDFKDEYHKKKTK